jgi:hypothetical protein
VKELERGGSGGLSDSKLKRMADRAMHTASVLKNQQRVFLRAMKGPDLPAIRWAALQSVAPPLI